MPNLYITKNNTKTTMGLTLEKKTTPSLVVTCGNTTYYGSLTTCAAWATTPNKIVVTSGATTYYTMSPSKGNKFVNFIIPRECPSVEGTHMAKCCVGIAGSYDYPKNTVRIGSLTGHGVLGGNLLNPPNDGFRKALLYDSPDTALTTYYIFAPTGDHVHDTSIVFDDHFTYDSQLTINTKHKGVRVCNNYQTAPNFIYVGCKNSGGRLGNLGYDYLCINGTDNNVSRSTMSTTFYFDGTTNSGNTSVYTVDYNGSISYTSMANGPIQTRVGFEIGLPLKNYVKHTHHPNPYSGSHITTACYHAGYIIPWFGVNMMCYENDIDKLPEDTLLFTDSPIECFDQRCWEKDPLINNFSSVAPFVNGNGFGATFLDTTNMFCWTPTDYDGLFITHRGNLSVTCLGMWPQICEGSVGNCTYRPVLDLEHTHPNPNNTLYFCAKTYADKGFGVTLASPGRYVIRHK